MRGERQKGKPNIWKVTGFELSKFDKRYEPTHPRRLENFTYKKYRDSEYKSLKKNYWKINTNLKTIREGAQYIKRICIICISWLLIETMEIIFKVLKGKYNQAFFIQKNYPLKMKSDSVHVSMLKVKVKLLSHIRLFVTQWTVAYQAPPSVGFSRQEYRGGLPFPSPGDLPNPGIEPGSPKLQADALPSEPPGSNATLSYFPPQLFLPLFPCWDIISHVLWPSGRWECSTRGRKAYGWFVLMYHRNQHNIIK